MSPVCVKMPPVLQKTATDSVKNGTEQPIVSCDETALKSKKEMCG